MGSLFGGVSASDFEKYKAWVASRFESVEKLASDTISGRIPALEARITQTASESADAALEALTAVTLRRDQLEKIAADMEQAHAEIEQAKSALVATIEDVSSQQAAFLANATSLLSTSTEALSLHQSLVRTDAQTQSAAADIQSRLGEVQLLLEQARAIPSELEALKKTAQDANAESENIKSLLTHSMKRKAEFDELHKTLFGHEISDTEGNSQRVDGLRDELSKTYNSLKEDLENLDKTAAEAIERVEGAQRFTRSAQNDEFNSALEKGKAELKDVSDQLAALLPGALAAGLSAAYDSKKNEEARSLATHEGNFMKAVFGLVLISLIPFGVDVHLLARGDELTKVLQGTPQLILAILPLYFPVLWMAYSSNKRLNLSKRLIEEYTHKSVLGKTFSGLSNQIESLSQEGGVKAELRTRLLFNVLQVSAENPGKLITDYNKSDHPLMDVLEKSTRLSESIDSLSKIPGLSAVAKALSERRDSLLREQAQKVEEGVAVSGQMEEKPASTPG